MDSNGKYEKSSDIIRKTINPTTEIISFRGIAKTGLPHLGVQKKPEAQSNDSEGWPSPVRDLSNNILKIS